MTVVRISKKYFRPNEVPNLKGNANKARLLNWKAKTNISELINEMMTNDLELVRKSLLRQIVEKKILIAGQEGMVWHTIYKLLKQKKDFHMPIVLETSRFYKSTKIR